MPVVHEAILEIIRLWKDEKGRRYGRDTLWKICKEDEGLFPGLSSPIFYKAWNQTEFPPQWKVPGAMGKAIALLPDSARLMAQNWKTRKIS